jgi:2-polyprenyl-3-methyl-5-hydroxy-6-metoxy-1,4-benzoquinol methylase
MKAFEIASHLLPFTRYAYEGRIVACPVCGFADSTKIAGFDRRMKRLPTVMCGSCGLLYTNPMPTDAELDAYYSRYYRLDYQGAVSKPSGRHLRKRRTEAALRLETIRHLLPPKARTLDFGAGAGEFVETMLDAGFDAHGFEPGKNYGSHAWERLGGRVKVAAWQDVQFPSAFDLVTCLHVLEHLNTPVQAIEAMASWLAPGGKVFLVVPNMALLAPKGIGGLHFAHVVCFNQHNLILAAAKAGLRPLEIIFPTWIVFERGPAPDVAELPRLGLAAAKASFVDVDPVRSYLSYQFRRARPGR